jgi:hypothetical protein
MAKSYDYKFKNCIPYAIDLKTGPGLSYCYYEIIHSYQEEMG